MVSSVDNVSAPERVYYLPPHGTGLQQEWEQAVQQAKYTELCVRGHDLIANRIIKVRNSIPPQPVSMKDLYRLTGQIRRAIAMETMAETDTRRMAYGYPMSGAASDSISEIITPHTGRYAAYYKRASEDYDRIRALIKTGNVQNAYGEEYRVAHGLGGSQLDVITIHKQGLEEPVASLAKKPEGIKLSHAAAGDCDALIFAADNPLQVILNNPDIEDKAFWEAVGTIALELYHAVPLRCGSQTATLMVLAGIAKAMGYEVVPRQLEVRGEVIPYDHFIAAELRPYKEYIERYVEGFTRAPARGKPLTEPIEVDDIFIRNAQKKTKKLYSDIPEPSKRLAKYLNDCRIPLSNAVGVQPEEIPIKVNSLSVEDGKLLVKILPPAQQKLVNYALDFVGHEELINTLSLAQSH